MNLRLRFALLFSFFVCIILLVSVTSIYILYENFRHDEFLARVKERATQHCQYFFDVGRDHLDKKREMDRRLNFTLTSEKIVIYDSALNLLYANTDTASLAVSRNMFLNAKKNVVHNISNGFNETLGFYYGDNNNRAYIVISANDKFGEKRTDNLKIVLLATLIGGLVLSGLFASFYVRQIVRPLSALTNQMQIISESNLDKRVTVGNDKNELTRIARNFNEMLDRLENAFEMRKSFVQHASHELRTPLSSMLAQTEAALAKELNPAESHAILSSLREDQQHMIELTNSLLLLSKYEKLPALTDLAVIRVDELLYEAIDNIKPLYPQSHINVNFTSVPDNYELLTVMGNDVLLRSALQNLVKNACHYSEDNEVSINIDAQSNGMKITFDNMGKQLTHDEKQRLFIPFFRGENSAHKKGYGLGLSIVQRIINLHKGIVYYTAINERLNRFSISFPRLKA